MAFVRSEVFRDRARQLAGYNIVGIGQVHYSGPD
jgi:hypothetical protein